MPCQFLIEQKKGIFSPKIKKCAVLGTTIPDMMITKYCETDWFSCEAFREEMGRKEK